MAPRILPGDWASAVDRLRRGPICAVVRDVVLESRKDRVLGRGAEVAFFAVLSLFPGLLIAAGLIGYLDVLVGAEFANRARERTVEALQAVLTESASPVIESVESVFKGRYGGLLTVASLGALVSLSGAWAVLIEALNHAYDVPEVRGWWYRRLLGLGLGLATMCVVVLTLAVIVVGPLLGYGQRLVADAGLSDSYARVWEAVRLPLLGAVLATWLVAVFRVAPNRRTRWADTVPGALVTTTLWLLCTGGFHLYLVVIGEENPILGAFGGGIIVMTWAYLLSVSLLLGGELNAVLERHRAKGRE